MPLGMGTNAKGQSIQDWSGRRPKFLRPMIFPFYTLMPIGDFLMLCMFLEHGLPSTFENSKIPLLSTITGRNSLIFSVIFGFIVWMGLTFVIELIFYINKPEVYQQFDVSAFSSSAFNRYNTGTDASSYGRGLFRGLFLQGSFAASGKSFFISTVYPIFSLVHSMNPEIEKYGFWTMQIYYLGAGLFLALLALAWTTDWNCLWVFMRLPMYLALSF